MKLKILIIILFAFVIPIESDAKSKKPADEILDSIIYNNIEYKLIKTWWKNSKGGYNPIIHALANNEIIFTHTHGWTGGTRFIKIDGYLFIKDWTSYSTEIYDSQGKEIKSAVPHPDIIKIKKFMDSNKPLIYFESDVFGSEYLSLDGQTIIPHHDNKYTKTFDKDGFKYCLIEKSSKRKCGLIDQNLEWIFPFEIQEIKTLDEDSIMFLSSNINGKNKIFNIRHRKLIPYDGITRIDKSDLYIVSNNGKFGIYDSENDSLVIPLLYQKLYKTNRSNCFTIMRDGLAGLITLDNRVMIPPIYDSFILSEDNTRLVIVRKSNKSGVYDLLQSEEIIPTDFDTIEILDESKQLIKFKLEDFWGVMNLKGKEIIPTTRGYTKINYIKGLQKYTYEMYGYKGECNSLGTQLSKIAIPTNNNASTPRQTTSQAVQNTQTNTTISSSTSSGGGAQPNAVGTYTISQQGQSITTGNFTGVAGPDEVVTIEFYDDHITVNGLYCEYAGESNGKRKYNGMSFGGGSTTYFVDGNYNVMKQMALHTQFGSDWFNYTVVKGKVNIPKAAPYQAPAYNGGASNVNYNSDNSSKHNHKTYQPDCHLCGGSGKCRTCNGTHRYINPLTGEYVTCPNCKPDGMCSACGGTGKKNN